MDKPAARNQSVPINQAAACLEVLLAQVDVALLHLNGLCAVDGRLLPDQLNAHQKVSYELAFCEAELEAAQVMLAYAAENSGDDDICEALALAFCAENIRAIWTKIGRASCRERV